MTTAIQKPPTVRKYRLKTGKHAILVGFEKDEHGQDDPQRPITKRFRRGDIIETADDLLQFNSYGGDGFVSEKFELVHDNAVPVVKTVIIDLGEMTLEELQGYAGEEGIGLGGIDHKNKGAVLKTIREARAIKNK